MSLFGWFRGRGNKVKASKIVGNVVVGGNTGIIYQSFGGGPPPAPPTVNWAALPPQGTPFEYFNLLSWKCRLAPELIGRDKEAAELTNWARTGPRMRIRFLVGPGGAGKTRLAAEVAETLRKDGWYAGFTPLEQSVTLPLGPGGLFLLIDYPEAWREQVRSLLREVARKEKPAAPIRILLLSRRPLSEWQDDIIQCGAAQLCDAQEISIGQLDPDLALTLFKTVASRLAEHRKRPALRFDDTAIVRWLAANSELYSLPLLITAGAIHFVDFPDATLDIRGVDIIGALVGRERAQLDRVGRNAGWGNHAASRLIGLAALRDSLDEATLRRLANPDLEIGLPEPTQVVDEVRHHLGRDESRGLTAPGPDIVAAELLRQMLTEGGDRSPEWVWETLAEPGAVQIELLDRRIHDLSITHKLRHSKSQLDIGEAG